MQRPNISMYVAARHVAAILEATEKPDNISNADDVYGPGVCNLYWSEYRYFFEELPKGFACFGSVSETDDGDGYSFVRPAHDDEPTCCDINMNGHQVVTYSEATGEPEPKSLAEYQTWRTTYREVLPKIVAEGAADAAAGVVVDAD